MHKITILDCTLRDGEQAPGVFFTHKEKLAIADLLDAAGVGMIDAGMPSVSEDERATLRALCERGYRAVVAGTVRALNHDIDLAIDCGLSDVFLFMPVSPQHLRHKFGMTLQQVRPKIEAAVEYAVARGLRVHFVAEDTVRSNIKELAPILDQVTDLGAASIMICDTVGVMLPNQLQSFIETLAERLSSEVELGIHCHNDYGLATANTIAAVGAGCTIVSGTINGLGERAGNAALEEVVCALENLCGLDVGIKKPLLMKLCEKVARASGVFVMPTKPVSGLNVFRHESGVHVDGMLKDLSTYESINPVTLGREHEFVLGKHGGTGLIEKLLAGRNIYTSHETLLRILERVKRAKVERDKAEFDVVGNMLDRFWARHLSFSEEEFWQIAMRELALDIDASVA
jgi:isopropylmalate/homocitrate/citramalate synthase